MNRGERARLVRAQSILSDVNEDMPKASEAEKIAELKRRVNDPHHKPTKRVGGSA